jgi:hypothetical protein
MNQKIKENHLADWLPIWQFDEDYMVFNDGSLGACFTINGKDITSLEAATYKYTKNCNLAGASIPKS